MLINQQFQSVFTKLGSTLNYVLDGEPYPQIKDLEISTEEVCKLLRDIKINKALGPDCIPNLLLSCGYCPCLSKSLHTRSQGWSIPSDWQNANINPLLKKGD